MTIPPTPALSVVIPTLGRPLLIRTLHSLQAARGFGRIEVLVAGRVHHETVRQQLDELLRALPNLRHLDIEFERGDSSEKKNAGWRAARSDIIAFLDDDVVVGPDWPEEMIASLSREAFGGVSGPSLVPPDVTGFARLAGIALESKATGYVSERYLMGHEGTVREVTWSRMIGCNMAYRREVLEHMGGFDASFWPGEEMLAAFRAGQKTHLAFNPSAWVHHYPRMSPGRFWKQIFGYGATRIRLIRAGVECEETTLLPALWVASLAALLLLAPLHVLLRVLLLLHLLAYVLVALWITSSKVLETRRWQDAGILPLVPFIHMSYGLGSWVEILRPNRDFSEKPGGHTPAASPSGSPHTGMDQGGGEPHA